MSARMKEERLETIELNLDEMKITQCRGERNQITPYHDNIIKLVEDNMGLIKKAKRSKVLT